ncbi:MAG: PilZ domain-containing protein [Gammaproteobacteria bacterium]|nr:PilZ domain-containing protein [Gammaproteobacteria bacterium]MDH5801374.1 PilZ domain-containing protein [Gammaproteobacteria bacterium]
MKENRMHARTPCKAKVKLVHSLGQYMVTLRDMSAGGVFLETEELHLFKVGDVVVLQIQGMMVEGPEIEAEVVRMEATGLGLKFLESDAG